MNTKTLIPLLAIILGPVHGKDAFTFGLVSDIQYCPCPVKGKRHYGKSLLKLDSSISILNQIKPLFTVQLGDLIEKDRENMDFVLKVLQKIQSPVFHVLGNHDYSITKNEKENLPIILGMKELFYDTVVGSWRLLFLNGNDLSFHAPTSDSTKGVRRDSIFASLESLNLPQAKRWNGGIDTHQMNWIQNKIVTAKKRKEKIILFSHYPIYPPDKHNLWNDEDVLKIMDAYDGVVAFISGHNHDGSFAIRNGVYHWTLKAMVDSEKDPAFAVVNVYGDSLVVEGFGREESRVLKY